MTQAQDLVGPGVTDLVDLLSLLDANNLVYTINSTIFSRALCIY